jgi:hypothetical protein
MLHMQKSRASALQDRDTRDTCAPGAGETPVFQGIGGTPVFQGQARRLCSKGRRDACVPRAGETPVFQGIGGTPEFPGRGDAMRRPPKLEHGVARMHFPTYRYPLSFIKMLPPVWERYAVSCLDCDSLLLTESRMSIRTSCASA